MFAVMIPGVGRFHEMLGEFDTLRQAIEAIESCKLAKAYVLNHDNVEVYRIGM